MKHITLLLFGITLIAGLTRFLFITTIPSELHRDEAGIAYNAYSLAEIGKDEHGVPYPITFASFGDYKLPVVVYLTSLSIKFFGLNVFAIRFPIALLGTLFVPISYFFSLELFKRKKQAVFTSILMTFNVWHIFLSRTVYEPIAGLTMSTLGLLFFLKARNEKKWFIFSAVFFAISCFTYNVPMLIMPLIICTTLIIFKDEYFKKNPRMTWVGCFLLLLSFLVPFVLTFSIIKGKSHATLFSDSTIQTKSNIEFDAYIRQGVPFQISRFVANPLILSIRNIFTGYIQIWNPVYLFALGNNNPWHSLQFLNIGQFQWGVLPFLILGLSKFKLEELKKNKILLFIFLYLLISPLANAVTLDSPNTNRLMDFHFALTLVTTLGFTMVYDFFSQKNSKYVKYVAVGLFSVFILTWIDSIGRYFLLHRYFMDKKWNEGIGQTATYLKELNTGVDKVYIDAEYVPDYFLLYPYFGIFAQIKPNTFQQTTTWGDHHLFLAPNKFDNYQYISPFDLSGASIHTLTPYFPPEVHTVIFVRRLHDNFEPSPFKTYVVNDAEGKAIWEVAKISREDVQKMPNSQ